MNPLVSVIIVSWNGRKLLKRCLPSVCSQDYKNIEILVVDNGSIDGTIDFLMGNYPSVRIVRNGRNLGFAEANNVGAREAKGELLLLLNNDTIVEKDCFSQLIDRMGHDPKLGICQPKIKFLDEPRRLDSMGSFPTYLGFLKHCGFGEIDLGQYDHIEEVFSPKGACVLIRKNIFFYVGGFDSDFFCYFEETDLAWRIWLAGFKTVLVPKAVVLHEIGATSSGLNFSFIQYHSTKNRICTLIKNLSWKELLFILPINLWVTFSLSMICFMLMRMTLGAATFKGILWNIKNLRKTLNKRRCTKNHICEKDSEDIFLKMLVSVPIKSFLNSVCWYLRKR